MADNPRPVVLLLLIVQNVFLRNVVFGVTLSPCGDDDTAEVEQGKTDNTFYCSGLGSGLKVDWTLVHGSVLNAAGSCPAVSDGGDCVQGASDAFTPSRVSNTKSKMVVDPTRAASTELIATGTLRCADSADSSDSCQMDYIVPVSGSCLAQTGTGSSRFELSGSCTLNPGAQSSRGRFKCRWTRQDLPSWRITVELTKDNYQTGCTTSGQALPTATGQYSYDVMLFPGRRSVSAGTIDITRPAAPAVTGCGGSDFIPENTAVSCTCTTDTIGQPSGRLLWVKVGDSGVSKVGNYGDKSWTVSQTLLRSDHQSSEFRCNVGWITTIPGASVKFNVGYPPTQVLLELNQVQAGLIVEEHQSVDFSCGNSNGRPDPTLSLVKKDNSSVLFNKTSTLSHEVVARCEDSGQYFCTADNGMGPAISGTPRSLYVQCSPRGDYDVGEVNFDDDPVSTTFDVTAHPVPDLVTFGYLGPELNDTGEPSEVNDDLIQLTGVCRNKPGVTHQSTCTVTVTSVTSHTAAGFYQVAVSNSQGSGHFRLQVLYKDRCYVNPCQNGGTCTLSKDRQSFICTCPPSYSGTKCERLASVTAPPCKGDEDTKVGAIVGGVVAVVVVIAIVIIVVVALVVKRREVSESSNGAHPNREPETTDDGYLRPMPRQEPAGPYESLQMAEVGQRSVYSSIGNPGKQSSASRVTAPSRK